MKKGLLTYFNTAFETFREGVVRGAARISEGVKKRKRQTMRQIEYRRLRRIRKLHIPQYEECKNCGEQLHGMYCSRCGQYALDINQGVSKYISQFLENTYQIDGRAVQTLRFLVSKPGFLSNEFIAGKIKSYMHPVKLFMFLSVVFFGFILLIFSNVNFYERIHRFGNAQHAVVDSLRKSGAPAEIQAAVPLEKWGSLKERKADPEKDRLEVNRMYREVLGLITKYAPFILLLLIPLYALFLRLYYRRTDPIYMHHLVFSFHLHSFLLLLWSIGVLVAYYLQYVGIFKWLVVVFVVYHIVAVHRMYRKGWVRATICTLLILWGYFIVLLFVMLILGVLMVLKIGSDLDLGILQ